MRYIILSIFLFSGYMTKAQATLNDYKYIVVPKRLGDFKKENQHQTSTLLKHLFGQKGFTTVWEDALPEDLMNNRCAALFAELREKSSMFATKASIVLKDCNQEEIFVTQEGKSKKKEFKAGYQEAISEAMSSFDGLNYIYNGKADRNETVTVSFKNDVKKLDEAGSSKTEDTANSTIVQEATVERQTYSNKAPVPSDIKKVKQKTSVKGAAPLEDESLNSSSNKEPSTDQIVAKSESSLSASLKSNVLYAQKIENGFQLVDSSPKIVLKILKSSNPEYYFAEGELGVGMVYSKNGRWYFEHYVESTLTTEELNIKF